MTDAACLQHPRASTVSAHALLAVGCLPTRPDALLRVYGDAWREGWPDAGPDGVGVHHRGWVAHRAFWGRGSTAVLRYRRHFVALFAPASAAVRVRVDDWLSDDLHRPRRFFSDLRAELLPRLSVADACKTMLIQRPWRAGLVFVTRAVEQP